MNERIRELAEQAKAESSQWLGSKPAITITYDELEKFAELIVRECAGVANQHMEHNEGTDYNVGGKIKQHFGVEE
jgi:hypothetical protein